MIVEMKKSDDSYFGPYAGTFNLGPKCLLRVNVAVGNGSERASIQSKK
jgi:hypothetical protein